MPKIDNPQLFRCVQIVRRLYVKHSEVGVFWNMSIETLADATAFGLILDFLEANRSDRRPGCCWNFPRLPGGAWEPIEQKSVAALAGSAATASSLDNVTDRFGRAQKTSPSGSVRYIKIPGGLLLDRAGAVERRYRPRRSLPQPAGALRGIEVSNT